jgi:ABC-type glycerol-3-phosphate transport system permease component
MSAENPVFLNNQDQPLTSSRQLNSERLWKFLVITLLCVVAFFMLLPFLWLISSSLKLEQRVFLFPPQWIPDPIRWVNYLEALTYKPFFLYLRNTMIIVIFNEIAIISTSSICGYALARIPFPGRNFWFGVVVVVMMIPYFVIMVPTFIMLSRIGWVNTYLPLTVPYFFGGGAFNVFLFRQFFRTIPTDLSDAARIDGCGEFGIYWRIIMPLSKPAIIVVAIFTFLNAWNSFIEPLLYINDPNMFTVALGLANFRGDPTAYIQWNLLMAASASMTIPVILIYFAGQRYFIQGVVMSGIKA